MLCKPLSKPREGKIVCSTKLAQVALVNASTNNSLYPEVQTRFCEPSFKKYISVDQNCKVDRYVYVKKVTHGSVEAENCPPSGSCTLENLQYNID